MEDQKQLVKVIQSVHEDLRYKVQKDPSQWMEIWKTHCESEYEHRKEYADSMERLATEIWNKSNKSDNDRILWCYMEIIKYWKGKGEDKEDFERVVKRMIRKYTGECVDDIPEKLRINLFFDQNLEKLNVLDVGSCYNPFSQFSNSINLTAVDLTPARNDVLECDFVTVKFNDEGLVKRDNGGRKVESLPARYFHSVVFCLLLEYLPSTQLRILALHNAYKALTPNGILIIVTPDSKHEQKNMPIIKAWKQALYYMGFDRINYEKLSHLHCMTFRKLCEESLRICDFQRLCAHPLEELCDSCIDKICGLLRIPQDKHDYIQKFESTVVHRTLDQDSEIAALLKECPLDVS